VLLPDALSSGINNALSTRLTGSKFDFRKKEEQQVALIATLRALLTEVHSRMSQGQRQLEDAVHGRRALAERERVASDRKEELEKQVRVLTDDVSKLKDIAKRVQKAYNDTKANLAQKETELTSTSSNRALLESRLTELETTRSSSSERLREAEKELLSLRERLRTEEEATGKYRAQLAEKDSELSRTLAMFGTAQSFHQVSAKELQEQVRGLIDGKHKAELDLRDAQNELSSLRTHLNSAQASLSSTSTDKQSLQQERDDVRKDLAVLQTQIDELRRQLGESAHALAAAQAELQTTAAALAVEKEGRERESQQKTELQERAVSLHAEITQTKEQLMSSMTETSGVRQELSRAKEDWAVQRETLKDSHAAEKEGLMARMVANEEKFLAERCALDERFNSERCRLESESKVVQEELRQLRESRDALLKAGAQKDMDLERLGMEADSLRRNVGLTEESSLKTICALELQMKHLQSQVADKSDLIKRLEDQDRLVNELRAQLFTGETSRRRMHNTIQELKGNIRVLGRIRPFLAHDSESEYRTLDCAADERSVKIYTERQDKPYAFTFDRVLPPSATQVTVFEEVSQLVQSALDGYHVCLFSYGQTGSGKTHTMAGGRGEHAGIIPRSVAKIIESVHTYNQQGWEYTLEAAFSEIYNDKLIDLLNDNGADCALEIRRENNRTYVPGLTRIAVSSTGALEGLMARANKNRSTATTDMNERSSRSHLIFTLYLKGTNKEQRVQLEGTLNLCDLAGSERLDRSCVAGERLKETQAINKSLSALSGVFTALSTGQPHIPFRNSKLTYLLQDCFAGDGKTMMVVNLSPTMASAAESLCSLRFAATVSQVHLGTAKKNIQKTAGNGSSSGAGSGASSAYSDVNAFDDSSAGATPVDGSGDGECDEADMSSAAIAPSAFRKRSLAQSGPSYMQQTTRVRTVGAGVGAGASTGIPRIGTAGSALGGGGSKKTSTILRK
jgi:kinesin family protein C1